MSGRAIEAATRVAAGASRSRYDGVAIALHWLTVALVLANFGLAEFWGRFARPTRHTMVTLHMSLGILLGAVVLFRIVWRFLPGHRVAPAVEGLTELASKAVHWLLYGLIVLQAGLGFTLRWSGGEAMSFFGAPIAPMIPRFSKAGHHLVGQWHNWIGWTIIVLAAGHAAAALWHHFIARDRVLVRMLPRGRRAEA